MSEIRLPGEVSPGQEVMAEDFNALLRAVRAAVIRPGVGYQRSINAAGTTLKIKDRSRGAGAQDFAPFAVRSISKTSETEWQVTLEPGRVSFVDPVAAANDEDGRKYYIPEIDETPMNEEDVNGDLPKLTISDGEMIYCKIARGADGAVQEPVEVVVDSGGEDSDHYQPIDPDDSGHESRHDMVRILELVEENDEATLIIWRKSDIDLTPFLWRGNNVGSGARVFKQHDEEAGEYDFRSVSACWGAKVEEIGDEIQVEAEAENVGEGVSGDVGTVLIPRDEEDPGLPICEQKMKFKALAQGAASDEKQISITNEDENVRIHGNGVNGSLTLYDCADPQNMILEIFWEDGLITTAGAKSHASGCPDTTPP